MATKKTKAAQATKKAVKPLNKKQMRGTKGGIVGGALTAGKVAVPWAV